MSRSAFHAVPGVVGSVTARFLAPLLMPAFALLVGCPTPPVETMDAGGDAFVEPDDAYMLPDVWEPGEPVARYALTSSGFFDRPWPSDTRLTSSGHPDMGGFTPRRGLVGQYLDAVQEAQEGFSTQGAVYFRFGADVDVATLPQTLAASVATDASVMLIALDEEVPMAQVRHPIIAAWEARQTVFWPGRTLALRPADGFALLPGTSPADTTSPNGANASGVKSSAVTSRITLTTRGTC